MRKIIVIGSTCLTISVGAGLGVSYAQSNGLFSPAQPDWLQVRQQTPVTIPDAESIVSTISVATVTPQTAPTTPDAPPADDAVLAVAASVFGPSAPIISMVPMKRPIAAIPPAPVTLPLANATPNAGAVAIDTFENAAPLSIERAKTEMPQTDFTSDSAPVQRTPSAQTDAFEDIWLLGVYR